MGRKIAHIETVGVTDDFAVSVSALQRCFGPIEETRQGLRACQLITDAKGVTLAASMSASETSVSHRPETLLCPADTVAATAVLGPWASS